MERRVWKAWREGDPAAASAIGGERFRPAVQGHSVLCIAQASDFGPNDLAAIQVEVSVHCIHFGN
jgi:hypothetical protein